MSYAIPTSPALVKLAGREVVKSVFDTLNIELPLLISKNFPEVKAVEVEVIPSKVPVVQVLADPVLISINFPVVRESEVKYAPVPEVMAVASNTKAEEVVAVVTTLEVKVCEPVAEVTLNAPAPATVTPKVCPEVGVAVIAPESVKAKISVVPSRMEKSPVLSMSIVRAKAPRFMSVASSKVSELAISSKSIQSVQLKAVISVAVMVLYPVKVNVSLPVPSADPSMVKSPAELTVTLESTVPSV